MNRLSNGFASADDPAALQTVCDRLGPGTIRVFFERWASRLPLPLSAADRDGGFWWDLTMRQVETSRTIVLDAPRHARSFFEALVADNLDLGRPESVELIFKRDPRGRKADGTFKTAVDRHAEGVTINVFYKHSRAKQYLKDGRTPAHRNRDQRRLRHRLPAPAAQPRRPAGQGPCDQPAAAGH